jgi:hypothetical protein
MPCSTSYANQPPAQVHSMRTRSMNNIVQPRQLTDDKIRYSAPQALVAAASPANIEPTCYSNATRISKWRKAMQTEFNALLQNHTRSLVPPHPSQNIV